MTVLTPSFGPDFELCADLNRSVLEFSPIEVRHQIIVPRRDLPLFERLAGPRTEIRCEAELLPGSFIKAPGLNYTVNLRRPFPPVRGWILQQLIKLAAVAKLDADVALLVDSDIEFVRPFAPSSFARDGVVRFYRLPGAVHDKMPRHVLWHRGARDLLGLPVTQPPMTDYVSSLLAWDPAIVRALLARVQQTTGRRWTDAIGAQLHFSEWTLYGVFVDEVLGASATSFASDTSLCHALWGTDPLNDFTVGGWIDAMAPDDLAIMISAKSHTPLPVRRAASAAARGSRPGQRI